MKDFSTIRELINDYGFDIEKIKALLNGDKTDISSVRYRLIASSDIDRIMAEELASDEYMLGCFNAWFLADILRTSQEAIQAMQEKEAYEGIGKMIIHNDLVDELQQAYVSANGYGHHFSHYDGQENEITLKNKSFYLFRIN